MAISSSSDMMLFTRHLMAASMLVLSCEENEKDATFSFGPLVAANRERTDALQGEISDGGERALALAEVSYQPMKP